MMISRQLMTWAIVLSTLISTTDAAPSPSGKRTTDDAISLGRRVVYDATITNPNANTTWRVGTKVVITWNTNGIPEGSKAKGKILLGHVSGGDLNEHLDHEHPLAESFLLSAGSIAATVPEVETRQDYVIVLLGDSGNKSPTFSIE
ncbi:hypothetical protein BJ138DRAFT_1068113 [Hygrophoropsis aurantiaca]|uniref:Uncharacterized protein n=1 Tax=Hygrophoropsis aurantiaca TaxID=72124 RepID=A0ACB8A614_9AGAM|nr:hypothetical protein BJ138DRAFT_1068113 [Hygrophoropsis aurantiaca]